MLNLTDSEWDCLEDPAMLSKSWNSSVLESSVSKLSRKSGLFVNSTGAREFRSWKETTSPSRFFDENLRRWMNMREVAIPIAAWNGLFALHSVLSNIFNGSHAPKSEPRNNIWALSSRTSDISMARWMFVTVKGATYQGHDIVDNQKAANSVREFISNPKIRQRETDAKKYRMFSCNKTALRDWRWLSFTRAVLETILLCTANPKRMNSYTVAEAIISNIPGLNIFPNLPGTHNLHWSPPFPAGHPIRGNLTKPAIKLQRLCALTTKNQRNNPIETIKRIPLKRATYFYERETLNMTRMRPYFLRAVVKGINTYLHDDFNRPEADGTHDPHCWVCCQTPIGNGILSVLYGRNLNKTYSAGVLNPGRVNECIWSTSKMRRKIV